MPDRPAGAALVPSSAGSKRSRRSCGRTACDFPSRCRMARTSIGTYSVTRPGFISPLRTLPAWRILATKASKSPFIIRTPREPDDSRLGAGRAQIFLIALAIGVKHVVRFARLIPVVDDPTATALPLPSNDHRIFRRPPLRGITRPVSGRRSRANCNDRYDWSSRRSSTVRVKIGVSINLMREYTPLAYTSQPESPIAPGFDWARMSLPCGTSSSS